MATSPVDPIDEELRRLLVDPDLAASLDDFLERERRGALGPGVPHDEVARRFGLDKGSPGLDES